MNGRKTDRQMYIYKELLSIYTITSEGFFASFNTWFQYCISYWLYSESTTLWHEKAYKIFCEYFFVWFMKSLLHSFMNLDVNFYSFTNLENRSNLLLDSRHPCIPKWRTWFYPAARFSKYLTILERYAVNGLITFTVELIFRNCWMYIVSIKRK